MYRPDDEALGFHSQESAIEYAEKAGFMVDDQQIPIAFREDMTNREFHLEEKEDRFYWKGD